MKNRTTRRKSQFVKLRAATPYNAKGGTNFPFLINKTGVYQIKENGKLVYVGYSAENLYKTMYRHFQKWNHRGQVVVTYADRMQQNRYTVQVTLCSPAKAMKLEKALILRYVPRDNPNKYKGFTATKSETELFNDWIEQTTEEAPF